MSRILIEWFHQNFDVKPTQNPNKIYICCPLCPKTSEGRKSADTKFHMGVTFVPAGSSPVPCVHCFRCGYSASIKRFIASCEGPESTAFRRLKTALDIFAPTGFEPPSKISINLPASYERLDGNSVSHRYPISYLTKRGVTKALYQQFGIGLCMDGAYSGRIIFPIYYQKKLEGFTARLVSQTTSRFVPKYQFPSGFSSASFLYNFDRASTYHKVIVVEGVFDVFRFPNNAVALFGKAMSAKQKLLLASNWDEVILMLDSDAGESAYKIQKQLAPFVTCSVAKLKEGDPADTSLEDIEKAIGERNEGMEVFL